MALEHFDGGEQRRCRDLAVAQIGSNNRLRILDLLANNGLGMLSAKRPAAVAGLAARSRRDVPFTPTDPAIAVAYLDDDRLELVEGAIGEHVWPNQRKAYFPQRHLFQLHRSPRS